MMLDIQIIEDVVCKYYRISANQLFTQTRKKEIREARQVFHYLSKIHTGLKFKDIGKWSGNHRLTAYHSFNVISGLLEFNIEFKESFKMIESDILERIDTLERDSQNLYNTSFTIAREVMACRNKAELNEVMRRLTPVL